MSAYDRFLSNSGPQDLASFFRSLANAPGSSNNRRLSHREPPRADDAEYSWDNLRVRKGQAGQRHLEFFDHGLIGERGALLVLNALAQNPSCDSMTLSQNDLGDNGLRELLMGMKRLRTRAIGGQLREMNLSSTKLSDVSLHLIALHLLLPSPHPPSLTHLYLTANSFSLGASDTTSSVPHQSTYLPEFLGSALSSSQCSLQCLALTNNPRIGTVGLSSLLQSLKLGTGACASRLSQLHFSVCGLTPDAAEVIALWLEDQEGGRSRLQVLCINGNMIGSVGLRRIARSVIQGHCTGLLHLEAFANEAEAEDQNAEWLDVITRMEQTAPPDEPPEGWRESLKLATERNKVVLKETRFAALRLLSKARILFGGNARNIQENDIDMKKLRQEVETMDPSSFSYGSVPAKMTTDTSATNLMTSYANLPSTSSPSVAKPFLFLRLPIELQVHVLRCYLFLEPSKLAYLYPIPPSSAAGGANNSNTWSTSGSSDPVSITADHKTEPAVFSTSSTSSLSSSSSSSFLAPTTPKWDQPVLSSPLTEPQFLRVLSFAASRATLKTEMRVCGRGIDDGVESSTGGNQVLSINGYQNGVRTSSLNQNGGFDGGSKSSRVRRERIERAIGVPDQSLWESDWELRGTRSDVQSNNNSNSLYSTPVGNGGSGGGGGGGGDDMSSNPDEKDVEIRWEDWVLWKTGCDRFERV